MKCSSNSNYEIISLCDIKTFNNEIGIYGNMPWTQISIPKTLNVPKDKPLVTSISKIYIDVKITALKVIETPKTRVPNSEGMILTGKKLLVNGYVCEKIVYNSCISSNKSLNAIEFEIPFSTYIVIDPDTSIHIDKFNIKTCIEDVFVTPISEKTILQSASLVLFANKLEIDSNSINPNLDVSDNIYNGIIVKSIDNKEIATIKFDLNKKTIFVESTNDISNENLVNKEYFSLILRSPDNFVEIFSTIESNATSKKLHDSLNNIEFDFSKTIELRYFDNTKIIITNLPSKNSQVNPKVADYTTTGSQIFAITEKGLIAKE